MYYYYFFHSEYIQFDYRISVFFALILLMLLFWVQNETLQFTRQLILESIFDVSKCVHNVKAAQLRRIASTHITHVRFNS